MFKFILIVFFSCLTTSNAGDWCGELTDLGKFETFAIVSNVDESVIIRCTLNPKYNFAAKDIFFTKDYKETWPTIGKTRTSSSITAYYTIKNVNVADAGTYRCMVKSGNTKLFICPMSLTVQTHNIPKHPNLFGNLAFNTSSALTFFNPFLTPVSDFACVLTHSIFGCFFTKNDEEYQHKLIYKTLHSHKMIFNCEKWYDGNRDSAFCLTSDPGLIETLNKEDFKIILFSEYKERSYLHHDGEQVFIWSYKEQKVKEIK